MKKKILSFVLAICLIIPAMFCMSGCTKEDDMPEYIFSTGLVFELINNNTEYAVADIGQCKDTNIFIPSTYNGKNVTRINQYAFDGCNFIMSVVLPDSIKAIDLYAFRGCVYLETITMSKNLEVIWRGAFENCNRLVEVKIPNTVERIGWNAFTGCEKLSKVVFEDAEDWTYGEPGTTGAAISSSILRNYGDAAECITTTHNSEYWQKNR